MEIKFMILGIVVVILSFVFYCIGYKYGKDIGWFKGYEKGREDANEQAVKIINQQKY